MNNIALELHRLFNSKKRYYFSYQEFKNELPKNGIYILFEKGEKIGDLDRIVRVGTHTGDNQLRSRLNQHFVNEKKDRSIFRKNIGRCFLNKENHPYQKTWELDLTSKASKEKNGHLVDKELEMQLEKRISQYIQSNLSFFAFHVDTKEERLFWESRITSTLAQANIPPSPNWLGNHSPKEKIKRCGLWQVNELFKTPLNEQELIELKKIVG